METHSGPYLWRGAIAEIFKMALSSLIIPVFAKGFFLDWRGFEYTSGFFMSHLVTVNPC